MWKRLLSICVLCVCCVAGWAQEFNCKVTVVSSKITGVDPQVFVGMQKAIADFINTHKWSSDDYAPYEKLECNILITLTGNKLNGDPEAYGASISIQASRPVYNSGYSSTLVNYVDKDFIFKYSPFTPMRFDDNQVSGSDAMSGNLTAVLAYYCYVMIALDNDSFSPVGGTVFLKKAQNIVNNAPEGKGITGWKAMENTHNRYWLVDQLLNARFEDVRRFWYQMHREGLDSMYQKPNESRTRILVNIKKLYTVNRENPGSVLMQFLFSAKSSEFINLLGQAPKQERPQYILLLNALDVLNAAKYNALK
jgi:hypothetical protein